MLTLKQSIALVLLAATPFAASAGIVDAASEDLGLYPARSFQVATGKCGECRASRQALWHFQQEQIAAPAAKAALISASSKTPVDDELPLVWLGSTKVINGAMLSASGKQIDMGPDGKMAFSIVPKLSTNLSYFNDATEAFYAKRPLRLRGEVVTASNGARSFVARTIWPQDFAIAPSAVRPLASGETLLSLIKAEQGGAKSPFATRVLWRRDPSQKWAGKAVMGLMLNGAQGDDDEAHGGHFGVVTGKYTDGSFHHWLVNNFYGINSISEKGIVAAVTPMDKYMTDLNNGQSFYRPSYMLVAILKSDQIPRAYQAEINHVFDRFYRHEFEYDHAKANCSGISTDGFRNIGWSIPFQGNSEKVKAIPAYAYVATTKGSLHEGRKIYDYLTEESTRLYPARAFDVMGEDMLALVQGKAGRSLTDLEKALGEQLEAIVFVRIPQIPSSRAYGLAPIASFSEYLAQAPEDRSKWKIVPTEPRPFPDELREYPAPAPSEFPVPMPVGLAALLLVTGFAVGVRWVLRRWKK
jgi:hypothetical protein